MPTKKLPAFIHPAIIVTLVILIVAGILIAKTAFKNSSNEETNQAQDQSAIKGKWETYKNTTYNFEINYPKDWKVRENNEEPTQARIIFSNPKSEENALPNVELDIDNFDLGKDFKENAEIVGVKAYRTSHPSGMQAALEILEFKKNGNRYEIALLWDDGKYGPVNPYNKNIVNTFNEMLSSLKFNYAGPSISFAKDTTIPLEIRSTLPQKTTDGKNIERSFISDDSNYLVFGTYVKTRGAGKEEDYWLFDRSTSQMINLSKLIKTDQKYQEAYKDNLSMQTDLSLVFDDNWVGENPIFNVADGWMVVGDYWEYDIAKGNFNSINREQ